MAHLTEAERHIGAKDPLRETVFSACISGKRPIGRFQGNCYNCGKAGYISAKCRAPRKLNGPSPGPSLGPSTGPLVTPGGRRGLSPGPEHAAETSWMANTEPNPLEPLLWVIDSGASRHMTFSRESFSDYMPLTEPILITTANGATIQALGQGTVPLRVTVQGTERAVALTEVLYAPGLSGSLISVL